MKYFIDILKTKKRDVRVVVKLVDDVYWFHSGNFNPKLVGVWSLLDNPVDGWTDGLIPISKEEAFLEML